MERLLPSEQREFKDMILKDIRTRGDSPVIGAAFRGYFDLKRRIELGKGMVIDSQIKEALYMGFVDVIGSKKDVDMVLDKWKKAQDRQTSAKPEAL